MIIINPIMPYIFPLFFLLENYGMVYKDKKITAAQKRILIEGQECSLHAVVIDFIDCDNYKACWYCS